MDENRAQPQGDGAGCNECQKQVVGLAGQAPALERCNQECDEREQRRACGDLVAGHHSNQDAPHPVAGACQLLPVWRFGYRFAFSAEIATPVYSQSGSLTGMVHTAYSL